MTCLVAEKEHDTLQLDYKHQKALEQLGFRAYFNPSGSGNNCMMNCFDQMFFGDQFYHADVLRPATAKSFYHSHKNPPQGSAEASHLISHMGDVLPKEIRPKKLEEQLIAYCNHRC